MRGVDPALLPYTPQSSDPLGDVRAFHNRYLDAVRLQERTLGGMLGALRGLPSWDDTAVMFVSDHGEQVREHWDGKGRWTRFGYQKKAKVVSAELDPDHTVQIDRNDFNNSFVVEGNGKPAHKLANYWLFITQFLSQALGWWAV